MYCDSWYSGDLVGRLGTWSSPGSKVKIIKSSWSRFLAWPSCLQRVVMVGVGCEWPLLATLTFQREWLGREASREGSQSRQGGSSAYQELCFLKSAEVLRGDWVPNWRPWDSAIQGGGVCTGKRWLSPFQGSSEVGQQEFCRLTFLFVKIENLVSLESSFYLR